MTTYEEGKKHRYTHVLVKSGEVVATFGNLKKVIEYLSGEPGIPSYWTLTRKAENPLSFGEYRVWKVKHH